MRALIPTLWLAMAPAFATPSSDTSAPAAASADHPALGAFADTLDQAFSAITGGASPAAVLPVELEPTTEATRIELAELVSRSGAVSARVEAIELHLAWPEQAVQLTVSPRDLAIRRLDNGLSVEQKAAGMSPYLWREPFVSLALATVELGERLRSPSCATARLVSDADMARTVPPRFLERARTRRADVRDRLAALCEVLRDTEAELRIGIGAIHVNLYSAEGEIVGGLRTEVTRPVPPYRMAYPQFKALR